LNLREAIMKSSKIKIEKPWGHEIIWAKTEKYVGKKLFIKKGHRLSRQFHEKKDETIIVESGILTLEIGSESNVETTKLEKNENFHIYPGLVHRFCAIETDVLLCEVSTPEIEDVVRLEDDYNRAK